MIEAMGGECAPVKISTCRCARKNGARQRVVRCNVFPGAGNLGVSLSAKTRKRRSKSVSCVGDQLAQTGAQGK